MFISHYHNPEDGFPNLEEGTAWILDDQASESSVVRRSVAGPSSGPLVLLHKVRQYSETSGAELNVYQGNKDTCGPKQGSRRQHRGRALSTQYTYLLEAPPGCRRRRLSPRNQAFQSPGEVCFQGCCVNVSC